MLPRVPHVKPQRSRREPASVLQELPCLWGDCHGPQKIGFILGVREARTKHGGEQGKLTGHQGGREVVPRPAWARDGEMPTAGGEGVVD